MVQSPKKCPESKHQESKRAVVQSPNVQLPTVPNVQSPSVQASIVQSSRSCVQSPALSIVKLKQICTCLKAFKFNSPRGLATFNIFSAASC